MDFIVGEWRTALEEPVDMSQSINCLARGILAIAIAGSAYFVIKACIHWITRRSLYASQWRSMVSDSYVNPHHELTMALVSCQFHVRF